MIEENLKLEAVYYPHAIPIGVESLTLMGLVFDRIHFPGVYIPKDGYDPKLLIKEIQRIENLGLSRIDDRILIHVLRVVLLAKDLEEVCYFTGEKDNLFGGVDKRTGEVVNSIYELVYGPPKKDFIPTFSTNHTKGLPDSDECIFYPGNFHYPANALLYASSNNLPLINDNPNIPVPAFSGESPKNNAKILSTVLAMECIGLILPSIKPMQPVELSEFRDEAKDLIVPFRSSLLSYAAELNSVIASDATNEEIQQQAKFMVDTKVLPQLLELKAFIEQPSKAWYNRAYDVVKKAPQLATCFFTMPPNIALANVLSEVTGILVSINNEGREKESKLKRSGLYYLLKLENVAK